MAPSIRRAVSRLKTIAKRSKWLVIPATIAKDQEARRAAERGVVPSTLGSTHDPLALDQSLGYINAVFDDYLTYGGLTPEGLRGKRVLELGPGDNFAVALRFLACGAEQVVTVDKFASIRDDSQQRAIYEGLLEQLDETERAAASDAIDLDGKVAFDPERLRVVEGVAVEEATELLDSHSFDLIVSRAVLEHLYDPEGAVVAIDRLLAPGGLSLHKVDFRDHGMFTDGGMHPLTFLTVPDSIYRLMTQHSGRPNRRLVDFYRAKLAELGYDGEVLVTRLVGPGEEVVPHVESPSLDDERGRRALGLVESIRPRLLPRFATLAPADLAIAGVFVSARKPA
jgi:SAM-dependent methyltransferase